MKNKNQKQQGDVLLRRVTENVDLSNGKLLKPKGRLLTLAEGEATGHHHSITLDANETDAELIQLGERMLLNLKATKTLTHQEHGPITIEPGLWEVGQVVEKDWLSGMVNPVVD